MDTIFLEDIHIKFRENELVEIESRENSRLITHSRSETYSLLQIQTSNDKFIYGILGDTLDSCVGCKIQTAKTAIRLRGPLSN